MLTESLPKTINTYDDISPIAINIINRESILFNTLSHYRVSVMNLKNNEIKKYFPIPIENPDVYNCQTWQSLISVNKDLLKIAIVTLGGEVIDILDIENNKTTRAIGEIGFPERLNFKDGFAPISNMCFTDVCCERNYIYALFLGEDYKKYMRKNEPMKYKVNIYDYDGKPIRQLMLNHNNITSFCIDETRNKILITVSDNENPLWEYDIIKLNRKL